jgi:Txe/YoeB family toxin of Txe-Axe toxin-antitoxin module
MKRRHFLSHIAGSAALVSPAINFTNSLLADSLIQKRSKSVILLWMGGGPSTIDLWDLKPNSVTGGPFKPISTSADGIQICEHLPLLSKQMHNLSVIRSMSTREADHMRGRYYMHTGYVPNPNVEHPSYGSVVSHELSQLTSNLEIPPFVSVGGNSVGPGFLGMTYAPFVVDSNGNIRDLNGIIDQQRMIERLSMLQTIEDNFINQNRGFVASEHKNIVNKTVKLMTSKQMEAFKINKEPEKVREKYGNTGFGRGCLMARRLVEIGVPFIEVDLGGWDNHEGIFNTLQNQKLPELDKSMSALISDLEERGLLDSTAIIWMGEFGRTPNINSNAGRDHWARSWSVVVGGAGFKKGIVVGETNEDGKDVITEPYSSQDLMASVLHSIDISLETTFTAKNGRPMKIANSGRVIKELF